MILLKILGSIVYVVVTIYAAFLSYLTFFDYPHGQLTGRTISVVIVLAWILLTVFIWKRYIA